MSVTSTSTSKKAKRPGMVPIRREQDTPPITDPVMLVRDPTRDPRQTPDTDAIRELIKPVEAVLTNPGYIPPPPGEFEVECYNWLRQKCVFLCNECPEMDLPSIAETVDLEDMEAAEVLEALPEDIKIIVQYIANMQSVDPVFSLSGFLQAAVAATGLRAGVRTSPDGHQYQLGTMHILSIGRSGDGKGRGVEKYIDVIDRIADVMDDEYDKQIKDQWAAAATEFGKKTRKIAGRKGRNASCVRRVIVSTRRTLPRVLLIRSTWTTDMLV